MIDVPSKRRMGKVKRTHVLLEGAAMPAWARRVPHLCPADCAREPGPHHKHLGRPINDSQNKAATVGKGAKTCLLPTLQATMPARIRAAPGRHARCRHHPRPL